MIYGIKVAGVIVGLILVSLCLGALLYAIRNIVTGRYLNRYYSITHMGGGIYELHFSPAFCFYYAKPAKYFRLRQEALSKFERGYPDSMLIAETSTLQDFYARQGKAAIPVNKSLFQWAGSNAISYFLIFMNLASYRKRSDGDWQVVHLVRRVHQTIPFRYIIINQKRRVQVINVDEEE